MIICGLVLALVLGTIVLDNFVPLGVYVLAVALPDLV